VQIVIKASKSAGPKGDLPKQENAPTAPILMHSLLVLISKNCSTGAYMGGAYKIILHVWMKQGLVTFDNKAIITTYII
jgi:hypothetical protein